jgi:hypothetical protein
MKKFLKVVGIIILVLVGWFVFDVAKNSMRIQKEMTEVQTIEQTEEGFYESQYGWKMKVPAGWGKIENKPTKMEMLVAPDKKMGEDGWTYVAVEPFTRVEEVDKGGFLKKYEQVLLEMFPEAKLAKESKESAGVGAKAYEYWLDHKGLNEMQLSQYRRYLFPLKEEEGWLIYSQTKIDDWEKLEPVIMEAVKSFN